MLQETQESGQLKPTISQLQSLMTVLNSRLTLSDFGNLVAGWEIWFRKEMVEISSSNPHFSYAAVPSEKALGDLTLAISENSRLGEEHTLDLKLTPKFVPWCIAFIKWSIGAPPLVKLDTGQILLDQKNTCIILNVIYRRQNGCAESKSENEQPQVTLSRRINFLKEVILEDEPRKEAVSWRGMMDVVSLMRYRVDTLLHQFPILDHDKDLRRMVGRAWHRIIRLFPQKFEPSQNWSKRCLMAVFPHEKIRLELAKNILGNRLLLVEDYTSINDAFVVSEEKRIYEHDESIMINCHQCQLHKRGKTTHRRRCFENHLIPAIEEVGFQLLFVSLFGDSNDLCHGNFPMFISGTEKGARHWFKSLRRLIHPLGSNDVAYYSLHHRSSEVFYHIFAYASSLLGHVMKDTISEALTKKLTLISCKNGQVLYPQFIENTTLLTQIPYLQLCAFPGQLIWDGMSFDRFDLNIRSDVNPADYSSDGESDGLENDESDVETPRDMNIDIEHSISKSGGISIKTSTKDRTSTKNSGKNMVIRQRNKKNDEEFCDKNSDSIIGADFSLKEDRSRMLLKPLDWKVSVRDSILCGELENVDFHMWKFIDMLFGAFESEPCLHNFNRTAGSLGEDWVYGDKERLYKHLFKELRRMLYITNGSHIEQLQTFLSINRRYKWQVLIHREGCIRCALETAEKSRCEVIIS